MTDWFKSPPKLAATKLAGTHRLPKPPPTPTTWSKPTTPTGPSQNFAGGHRPPPPTPWTKATTPQTVMPGKDTERMQKLSAQVVMHQFARSEVRELDKRYGSDVYQQVADVLWLSVPDFQHYEPEHMQAALNTLMFMLQSAELTINFTATSWFSQPNNYSSYTQMYERGTSVVDLGNGQWELRLKGNALNPADTRDAADARVTFGDNIHSPDRSGIRRLMSTGGVGAQDSSGAHRIHNGQFNPKSRQIFAALNYGRRPRGSTITYGKSKLVLRDSMKQNAIYFMGDTFLDGINASHRVSYGSLIAVLLHAAPEVRSQILDSCFRMVRLRDSEDMRELLEAHLFERVEFVHDIKEIVIDSAEATDAVKQNAEAFARKWGIKDLSYQTVL